MKKSTRITMIVGLTMLFLLATSIIAMAATPAFTMKAPLTQDVGILDKLYVDYTEDDCRACHGTNTADLHHMTPSALDDSDPTKGCIACHELTDEKTIATPIVRNCFLCHSTSWHHITTMAQAGTCTACHDPAILAEQGTGLVAPEKPTYEKSLVTPSVKDCANCHNDFNPTWDPLTQTGTDTRGPNGISHHAALNFTNCGFCHDSAYGPIGNILDIRMCESCHTITTLHTITQHTDSNDKCIGCHGTYMANLPQLNPANIPSIDALDTTTQKTFGYVVISGANFGNDSSFGAVEMLNTAGVATQAPASYWTDSEIRVMVPASLDPGNYILQVTTSGKTSNLKTVTVVSNPYISGMTPAVGMASTATTPVYVTLQGTSFATGANLAVNFVQGAFKASVIPQQNANGDLVAQVPVGLVVGKYLVNVSTSIGTSNTVYYTVGAAPKINLLSPSAAAVKKTIVITGSNLSLGSKPTVKFGTTAATVSSYTATKLYVTVPSMAPGATTVTVSNGFGTSIPVKFTVK